MPKNNKKAFYDELDRLLADQRVKNLNNYSQHNGTTTLRHVIRVAKTSFDLAERLGWEIDEKELARGAILHDYYQYEIKEEGLTPYRHGTRHRHACRGIRIHTRGDACQTQAAVRRLPFC